MRILFVLGIGPSFGELYAAVSAARELRTRGHAVTFASLCNDDDLIRQVRMSGFSVSAVITIPSLAKNYFSAAVAVPQSFDRQLEALFSQSVDLLYLIDCHHFWLDPDAIPAYATVFQTLQQSLRASKIPVVTNDHSLWSLFPHPFPAMGALMSPLPECVKAIVLPSPPHSRPYAGLTSRHHRGFFYNALLDAPKRLFIKQKSPLRVLVSISHFAVPLADARSSIGIESLLRQSLLGISALSVPVILRVTGIDEKRLQAVALPKNVHLQWLTQLNQAPFEEYDRELRNFDLIILFNALSTTITRAFFLNVPVLLLTHAAKEEGDVASFNVYPAFYPTLEEMCRNNPFYSHVVSCELFDDDAIRQAVVQSQSEKLPGLLPELRIQLESWNEQFIEVVTAI